MTFNVFGDFMGYCLNIIPPCPVYKHFTGMYEGLHSVKIVGWGEQDNTTYWTVQNSWGEDFGDNGFFKIVRGANECGQYPRPSSYSLTFAI